MKKLVVKIVIAICILSASTYAQNKPTETIAIEGQYSGKNLVIKNSFGPGGVGYCVTETKVNGKVTKDEINANLFQVDLAAAGIKEGEKVKVEISYLKGCASLSKPLIINPAALVSNNTFVIEGTYMWQNLFVINLHVSKTEYSIKEVLVNGKSVSIKNNSDVLEIKLQAMNFKEDEKIKIEFKYAKGLDPVIINPEAIN
jgi:predicted DNA-binding antitoxin AbrB/MazE fold protein